jgi:hypothetical protein
MHLRSGKVISENDFISYCISLRNDIDTMIDQYIHTVDFSESMEILLCIFETVYINFKVISASNFEPSNSRKFLTKIYNLACDIDNKLDGNDLNSDGQGEDFSLIDGYNRTHRVVKMVREKCQSNIRFCWNEFL